MLVICAVSDNSGCTSGEIIKACWFGSPANNYVNRAHMLLFPAEIFSALRFYWGVVRGFR